MHDAAREQHESWYMDIRMWNDTAVYTAVVESTHSTHIDAYVAVRPEYGLSSA